MLCAFTLSGSLNLSYMVYIDHGSVRPWDGSDDAARAYFNKDPEHRKVIQQEQSRSSETIQAQEVS